MHLPRNTWKRALQEWFSGLFRSPSDSPNPATSLRPVFKVLPQGKEVLLFRASAPQPRMTQVVLDLVRSFPSPLGLVLVEYVPHPREWLSAYLGRRRMLEALVKVRDLLGVAPMDLAIVSPPLGAEIIVDHLGVLEIRTGTWNEPLLREAFLQGGFTEQKPEEEVDEPLREELPVNFDHRTRIAQLVKELKLRPADPPAADLSGL